MQLCDTCGCRKEHGARTVASLSEALSAERKPRWCPLARFLRVCGQLGSLPSLGKAEREMSWHSLLMHPSRRASASDADEDFRSDLASHDLVGTTLPQTTSQQASAYPYRTAYPILRWLPTKMAEWNGDNNGDTLGIPARNDAGKTLMIYHDVMIWYTKIYVLIFGMMSFLPSIVPWPGLAPTRVEKKGAGRYLYTCTRRI
jgi:hypothetical protein